MFIKLIDAGAMAKAFKKLLGLSLTEVKFHRSLVGFYRTYIRISDEIVAVRKSDLDDDEKKTKIDILRKELDDAKD